MTEGTPKAIEPKGITRNATKIGVQDGQAEDLINLRFMDGSWRASGNGRQIENMPTGTIYQQLYVHTNVYHHLLGVDNGVLYWFAEIDNDGVTFYPLDGTTDRSLWPEDKHDLPTERVALTNVVGDIWITQTGHLLTVIDEADDFEFFVFKTGEKKYITVEVDVNGKTTDRLLYPFGQVHFNCHCPFDEKHILTLHNFDGEDESEKRAKMNYYSNIKAKFKDRNQFLQPFLVVAAIKLYDGSYIYASNPVYLHPREYVNFLANEGKKLVIPFGMNYVDPWPYAIKKTPNEQTIIDGYKYVRQIIISQDEECDVNNVPVNVNNYLPLQIKLLDFASAEKRILQGTSDDIIKRGLNIVAGARTNINTGTYSALGSNSYNFLFWLGSDLSITIDKTFQEALVKSGNVFQSICIFVTLEADIFKTNNDGTFETDSNVKYFKHNRYDSGGDTLLGYRRYAVGIDVKTKQFDEIANSLLNSPFYLLKEYKIDQIENLQKNSIIDLSSVQEKGLLKNLTQQKQLETESLSRTTYLPKVAYQYNGRLHIANYKTYPFFGYPLDLFHLHNHSVKVQENAWFPNGTTQKVLPNLTDNNDAYLQYTKAQKAITNYPDLVNNKAPYFIVKTYINSEQGEQVVCRYIQAYDPSTPKEGRADFIEDLNPLLTYPDSRAKKMEIFYVDNYTTEDYIDQANVKYKACAWVRMKEFKLTPHPYLNIAYFMDPDLHPIKLADFEQVLTTYEEDIYEVIVSKTIPELKTLVKMQNAEEYFPNGLKVSKTDQPMVFPVDNTYQVGSAEILALMSNTIAVGTGQTGNAPLYVFCKDGVYAQFVDASGQMAYLNARILARDVCNNPRSVTPIDAGVVFTTDRGLMMIAGEQVQEIGAPAEGDVVQFWNAGSVDYSKIATASMQQIAELPSELCSTTDFLTYLQDKGTSGKAAIINYNHNMRELMVSNPNYPYSYVLDREGNWSRRDYTAAQYVNNYPTSYRVDADGHFYKVDDEGDANTTLEHRKEADNKIFYLSNVIKLDSIGFKQAYRFVVRGYFETLIKEVERVERAILQKSIDSSNFYIEDSHVLSQTNLPVMNHLVGMSDVTDGLRVGDILVLTPIGNPLAEEQEIAITEVTRDDVYLAQDVVITEGVTGFTLSRKRTVIDNVPTNVACVVEGSYDGRKFRPLGYNRKSGKFRDIGCIVERTDVRFFRICLSGQVTGKTRIDYMEMSAGASMLNTKIR